MAATNLFLSIGSAKRRAPNTFASVTKGASTTATDYVELRMLTVKADGTTATNLTRSDVLAALDTFRWYIASGGLSHAGAGIPDATTGQA